MLALLGLIQESPPVGLHRPSMPPSIKNLASQTTLAAGWSAISFVVLRSASLVNQVVIAAFLFPSDLGAVALAGSLAMVGEMVQATSVGEVLLRRKKPRVWFASGELLAFAMGLIAMLLVLLAALFAGFVLQNQLVCLLMLVTSVKHPIRALGVVPRTSMSHAFRFREISIVETISSISIVLMTVILALFGFGAFSIVIPWVTAEAIKTVSYYKLTCHQRLKNPSRSKMRLLMSGNVPVAVGNFALQFTQQVDYLVLGLFYTETILGLYYFAFNLASQVALAVSSLVTSNLQVTLSSVSDDPERQYRGFLRACKIIATFGMPLCVLQALLAEELIQSIFNDRWHGSVVFLQLLSCGFGFRLIAFTCSKFMIAQGRYTLYAKNAIATATIFLFAIVTGALLSDSGVGVAIATCVYSTFLSFIYLYVSLPNQHRPDFLRIAKSIFLFPFLGSFVVLPAMKAIAILATSHLQSDWLTIAATTISGVILYGLLFRRYSPEVWEDVATQGQRAVQRRRPLAE
ncbi:MAG: oligosaccharide flippase family protein [Rubripirellula sp.]